MHYLAGYWKPKTLLDECRFAITLLEDPEKAEAKRQARKVLLARARDAETDLKRKAALGRLLRSVGETPAGQDIDRVLRQVEDDIYLKGAVG